MARKTKPAPKDRWEMSAERENERRRKKAPLLVHAGLVPLATAEERREKFGDARARAEREHDERQRIEDARGAELRDQVRTKVSPEKFAELQERRGMWPSDAAFFGYILKELERDAAPATAPLAGATQNAASLGPAQMP